LPASRDAWVFRGLLVLLFWAPLPLGSNRTWAVGILLVWVTVLLAGSAVAWRRHGHRALARLTEFRWPLLLLAALVALAWLQTLPLPPALLALLSPEAANVQRGLSPAHLSLDVYQSQRLAALAFVYLGAFVVAALAVRSAGRLERLARLLVWSGLFQAVLGALLFSLTAQYRLFHVDLNHTRVIGSFVYHNNAAGYLVMCLSMGIGLMLSRFGGGGHFDGWRSRLSAALAFMLSSKMRLRLMLVIMVVALVLTRSRMGNASFFVALLAVGAVAIVLARRTAPATIVLIASLLVIDIAVIGGWVGLERVVQRLENTELTEAAGGREESVETRTEAGRLTLGIVEDFPWFGTGGGSFYSSFMRYRSSRPGYLDHAHNDYAEIAADFGVVGLALMATLVGSSLWLAARVLARRRSSLPRGVAFGAAMSIVALAIHSLVDFNLQIPANALTMVIILAMVWLADRLPSSSGRRRAA
jgi:O-antigen ligase